MAAIDRVLAVMARLRDPQTGCPWDVAQDFRSIAPHTVEEAYEVADAIERGDFDDLRDELGDLLLQVVYHARMAEERDAFDFEGVADGLAAKLIRRHPHVFGEAGATDADTREQLWEQAKADERAERGESDPSALAGVTLGLPALTRAQKLSRRAARAGFDWPDASGPAAKVREELEEIEAAGEDPDAREAEVGDLLFAAVNLARHLDVDAETALRRAGQRFERRFRAVEGHARRDGGGTAGMPMDTLEGYWQAAKRDE
ncbi:nucleoside triphosphate pyrophosphohydrolase [Halofilum ochraceum]|uniref:nucleoside triphosphate pyrophosphohydrolase n=1 Tax=Halofilum ochraceum TaxID=1611323 RepID=UPI00083725CF|nr:nucleoside triphosphate pyrophosphohydrolase [Halofilum ochraceum]